MSNKKNETLKKVFRLTRSRKIAEIEPDVTTNQESEGDFMRRMRYINTFNNEPESQNSKSLEGTNIKGIMENEENSILESDEDHRMIFPSHELPDHVQLKELSSKINALDCDDLHTVVDLITETGYYEMNSDSFGFHLMKLQRDTIEKLEALTTVSTIDRRQCNSSPLPSENLRLQLIHKEGVFIKNLNNIGDNNGENHEKEREVILTVGREMDRRKKIERKLTADASDNVKFEGATADCVKSKKAKRKQRQKEEFTVNGLNEVNVKNNNNELTLVKAKMNKANKRMKKGVEVVKQKNRISEKIAIDEAKVGRAKRTNRCSACGRRPKTTGKNNKRHTSRLRLIRKQEEIMHVDNIKTRKDKKSKNRCIRNCIMEHELYNEATNNTLDNCVPSTLNPFNLRVTLALSSGITLWNGPVY